MQLVPLSTGPLGHYSFLLNSRCRHPCFFFLQCFLLQESGEGLPAEAFGKLGVAVFPGAEAVAFLGVFLYLMKRAG
jgi:hypothetical protein